MEELQFWARRFHLQIEYINQLADRKFEWSGRMQQVLTSALEVLDMIVAKIAQLSKSMSDKIFMVETTHEEHLLHVTHASTVERTHLRTRGIAGRISIAIIDDDLFATPNYEEVIISKARRSGRSLIASYEVLLNSLEYCPDIFIEKWYPDYSMLRKFFVGPIKSMMLRKAEVRFPRRDCRTHDRAVNKRKTFLRSL